MKNAIVLMVFCLSAGLFAQDMAMANESVGSFQFENKVLDYGTVAHNSDGERSFTFKNVGNAPILISRVKGSCGCTVPTKPKGPIMPGETAVIGVKYDTKREGAFSKSITVTSNASEQNIILKIKGKVLPKTSTIAGKVK
ncbi:MAG: DUF1573 domain-containing protein [Bacteroidetes bacterium]|nr:DUF1573 domain-containing protein [Bacteroidota bacterium]